MKSSQSPAGRTRHALFAAIACGAALLLGGVPARAGTLASGFLWSENASRMVCFVWNVSESPVTLQAATIVNASGVPFSTSGSCSGVLAPGKRCGFVAYDVAQGGGRVTIDAPRNRVRGTCQLLDDDVFSRATAEMR